MTNPAPFTPSRISSLLGLDAANRQRCRLVSEALHRMLKEEWPVKPCDPADLCERIAELLCSPSGWFHLDFAVNNSTAADKTRQASPIYALASELRRVLMLGIARQVADLNTSLPDAPPAEIVLEEIIRALSIVSGDRKFADRIAAPGAAPSADADGPDISQDAANRAWPAIVDDLRHSVAGLTNQPRIADVETLSGLASELSRAARRHSLDAINRARTAASEAVRRVDATFVELVDQITDIELLDRVAASAKMVCELQLAREASDAEMRAAMDRKRYDELPRLASLVSEANRNVILAVNHLSALVNAGGDRSSPQEQTPGSAIQSMTQNGTADVADPVAGNGISSEIPDIVDLTQAWPSPESSEAGAADSMHRMSEDLRSTDTPARGGLDGMVTHAIANEDSTADTQPDSRIDGLVAQTRSADELVIATSDAAVLSAPDRIVGQIAVDVPEPPAVAHPSTVRIDGAMSPPGATPIDASTLGVEAWRLLADGRISVAYHVSAAAMAIDKAAGPGPGLVALVGLAPHVDGRGALDDDLNTEAGDLLAGTLGTIGDHCRAVVITVACLRLGLLARASAAPLFLQSIVDSPLPGAPALSRLAGEVAALYHRETQEPITAEVFRDLDGMVDWKSRTRQAAMEAAEWRQRQLMLSLGYQRATNLWHAWLSDKQSLGQMLLVVGRDDRREREKVRVVIKQVSRNIGRLIDNLDAEVNKGPRTHIDYSARESLIERVQQALTLGHAWLEAIDHTSGEQRGSRLSNLRGLRDAVERDATAVRAELDGLGARVPSGIHARAVALNLFVAFESLVMGQEEPPEPLPGDRPETFRFRMRNEDLLSVTAVPIHDDWKLPEDYIPEPQSLMEIAAARPNWCRAARARLTTGDFGGCNLALWRAQIAGEDEWRAIDHEREKALSRARSLLARDISRLQNRLASAVADGQISEARRLEFVARLDVIKPDSVIDIGSARILFNEVSQDLEEQTVAARVGAVARLATIAKHPNESDRTRINQLIDRGQIEVATDYMDRLADGGSLPPSEPDRVEWRSHLTAFFPAFAVDAARQISSFATGQRGGMEEFVSRVASVPVVPPPLQLLADPENAERRRKAVGFLQAWIALRDADRELVPRTRDLLRRIFHSSIEVTKATPGAESAGVAGRLVHMHMIGPRLENRDVVVVPQVGSQAGGRYHLVMLGRRPVLPGDLVSALSKLAGPVIVLAPFALEPERRHDLAVRAMRSPATIALVIDDLLALYLAQLDEGERLQAFFDCTLPFTAVTPYVPVGGVLPPELFFGRVDERRRLFASTGTISHLVYGGRQLGKTALLRRLEAEHRDDRQLVVRYLDIYSIGRDASYKTITAKLAAVLAEAGVLSGSGKFTSKSISDQVKAWLGSEGSGRRIILMLDEADAFIASEAGAEFPNIAWLKALMEDTGRRFKVIFSGLQNVQRLHRNPNSPLAHFGSATLVGPMLVGGDLREAIQLVRQPLETLGFFISDEDAVMRILIHCNYYPSLIQMFCSRLLDHMRGAFRESPNRSLPMTVTTQHVEEVYESPAVRKELREKLFLTLDLDTRYWFLALLIAFHSFLDDRYLVSGIELSKLREAALQDWPAGFEADGGADVFRAILEEMADLGILRRSPSGYALRNPNILKLLGNLEQIEVEYEHARKVAGPPVAASILRRSISQPNAAIAYSPITVGQEGQLLGDQSGVSVILGSEISGIRNVPAAVAAVAQAQQHEGAPVTVVLPDMVDQITDRRALDALISELGRIKSPGLHIAVVPADVPWAPEWVDTAVKRFEERTSKTTFVRLVLAGDPCAAWRWISWRGRGDFQSNPTAQEIWLQPWSPRTLWAAAEKLNINLGLPAERLAALERTGGWSEIVAMLLRASETGTVARDAFLTGLPTAIPDWQHVFDDIERAEPFPSLRSLLTAIGDGEATPFSDLVATLEPPPGMDPATSIGWAEAIGIFRPEKTGLRADSLLFSILQGRS